MRRFSSLMLIALGGLFLVAADAGDDAIKKERAKLKGTWKIVTVEVNGAKPFSDDQLETVTTTIDGDGNLKVEAGGSVVIAATTKIDPTKNPKTVDITFTEGEMSGKTALGIYEISGDDYKYCRAAPDKPRPTEFSSKEGSEHTFVTYKREKSK